MKPKKMDCTILFTPNISGKNFATRAIPFSSNIWVIEKFCKQSNEEIGLCGAAGGGALGLKLKAIRYFVVCYSDV